ncbi:hypothetical protein [Nitrosomonas sp.]|uniref:hypothetical protein n=1 Tax=Nitrosomonas sp. TaxID=42353 RepID=UPI0025D8FF09|nr:hypothetical protein [Nitrosomonas sp.]
MSALVSRRSQRNIPRTGYKLANLLYATNWKGLSVASPTLVGGAKATRYPNAATSLTPYLIKSSGTVTVTLVADVAFEADDYIQMVDAADSANYMEGNVTEYNTVPGSKILKFNVQHSGGSDTKSDWKIGGTIPVGRNYTCSLKFAGEDAETGFALPTGAPFYASENTGFGVQDINWMDGYPTNDTAGVATSIGTTFESVVINDVITTAFVLEQKKPVAKLDSVVGYKKQQWAMMQRDQNRVGGLPDIPKLRIKYKLWVNDLSTKLSVTNRRVNPLEMKTITDFRYAVSFIKANAADAADPANGGVLEGTVGWELLVDNKANSLPVAPEFLRWKNFTVPVPYEQFFTFETYWQRSASYADETTGRFLLRVILPGETEYTTVFDMNAETVSAYNLAWGTSYVNRHMGIEGSPVHRIFFFGIYGKFEWVAMKFKCAMLKFLDSLID